MHEMDGKLNLESAKEAYNIARWGAPYFGINESGQLTAKPSGDGVELSLHEIYEEAKRQGLQAPLLIRFHDILRDRVRRVNEAFADAIESYGYKGKYRGVFPVKVNQMREVVEEIVDAGKDFHFGLEVGSKPELCAALAMHEDRKSLLICNGYKDDAFIRTALMGRVLGKSIFLVVEKLEELQRILDIATEMKVEPMLGIRVRLGCKGSGKWATSGGDNAKFGLTTRDLLTAVELLSKKGKPEWLQLLHFHVGSQVPDIQTIKKAVREGTRFYAKLYKMGYELKYMDVGGGLGIDYDGTRSATESSMDYTLEEYTRDVVYNIQDVCDEEKVSHPHIVSEGGRAIVAHHSVLLVETFGTIEKTKDDPPSVKKKDHKIVQDLAELLDSLTPGNRRETLHDALQLREEASSRFSLGLLDLETKAKVEQFFWHLAENLVALYPATGSIPDEVQELADQMGDQFLCNFSVFQSMIDHWALGQLFPIVPVHRLDEPLLHEATLVDITCDSDGKIDKFVDQEGSRATLPLHAPNGDPYVLGIFLMGAYQDVMGDLHNLFGAVNEVHIFLDEDEEDGYYIEETLPCSSIERVLNEVQFDAGQLARLMKAQVDKAIKSDMVKPKVGMRLLDAYEKGLRETTYLRWDEIEGPRKS